MNKYTELSDFEINKRVAIFIGFSCYYGDGSYTNGLGSRAAIVKGKNNHGNFRLGEFDPCNNSADAMPIIIGNLISLMADMSEDRGSAWWCASDISNGITSRYKSNPLRAAMEVFLMVKDAENEKV
ncbi:phage protein NinX family protein [Proteus terrae]|uniref:phage protein NinX family protein n=1 Tax=Proteus terrae TaxID=1574161 RepID=UPI000BFBE507|nr:phage protein NinX family protein [Proteus terrae]ATN01146.1 recombinase [Proteus vulgaris]